MSSSHPIVAPVSSVSTIAGLDIDEREQSASGMDIDERKQSVTGMDLDEQESSDLVVVKVQPVQVDPYYHIKIFKRLRDRYLSLSAAPYAFEAEVKKVHGIVEELNSLLPNYPKQKSNPGSRERPPRSELEKIFNLVLQYENVVTTSYSRTISTIESKIESDKILFGSIVDWLNYNEQLLWQKVAKFEDFNEKLRLKFQYDRRASQVERKGVHNIIQEILDFIEKDKISDST